MVLGSYNQWMRDPYTLLVNGRYKVSKNYAYDLTGAKYQDTGISLPKVLNEDGETQKTGIFYPHKYQTVPGFGVAPVHPCKGSTSTGGCDGLWQDVEITAVARRFRFACRLERRGRHPSFTTCRCCSVSKTPPRGSGGCVANSPRENFRQ